MPDQGYNPGAVGPLLQRAGYGAQVGPGSLGGNPFGPGQSYDPNTPIGGALHPGPETYGQLQQQFTDQNAAANQAAINQGYGMQLNYTPAQSAVAGLTQLGAMQNMNAAQIQTGQSNALMAGQAQNINALNAMAQGQGPSLAQEQAKHQGEANIAAQMGIMGSQRGASNAALGLRSAADQAAQANQQAVQAGVLGRTQEELGARQQLAGALQGATGQAQQGAQAQAQLQQQAAASNQMAQNQGALQQGAMNQQTAMQNAQAQQQTNMANLQAMLQAGQINMQQYDAMLQAQLNQSNNQLTASMGLGGLLVGENSQLQGIGAGVGINAANNSMGLLGAGIAGGATLGAAGLQAAGLQAASDRALKRRIHGASRSVKDFLNQLGDAPASSFRLMEVG